MSNKYILSSYINPHLFWLRALDSPQDKAFIKFEHDFDEYYKFNRSTGSDYVPHVGETVAYLDRHVFKWYRAVVDQINEDSSYILWLIDYGYAVHAYKKTVQRLKTKFKEPESFGNIIKAGIVNVLPSKYDYDFVSGKLSKVIVDYWDEVAVQKLKQLLDKDTAANIEFHKKLRIKDHSFGKVVVETNDGVVIDLLKAIVESPFAEMVKDVVEFSKELKQIKTTDIKRYENNKGQNCFTQDCAGAQLKNNHHRYEETGTKVKQVVKEVRNPYQEMRTQYDEPCLSTTTVESSHRNKSKRDKVHYVPQENKSSKKELPNTESDELSTRTPTLLGKSRPQETAKQCEDHQKRGQELLVMPHNLKNTRISPTEIETISDSFKNFMNQFKQSSPQKCKVDNIKFDSDDSESIIVPIRPVKPIKQPDFEENHLMSDFSKVLKRPRPPKTPKQEENQPKTSALASKPEISPILKELLDRQKRKAATTDTPSPANPPRILNLKPACYDEVISQQQRLHENVKVTVTPKQFICRQSKNSQPIVSKNRIMEMLNKALVDRGDLENETTSDDGSVVRCRNANLLLSTDVPMGPSDNFDEIESHFHDCDVVLAHGKRPARPIKSFIEAPFHPDVMKSMKVRHHRSEIRRIQAFGWPHILHERSAILIGGPSSGKTQTLIPAICTLVIRHIEDNQKIKNSSFFKYGPISIIVTPFTDGVNEIVKEIVHCLKYNDKFKRLAKDDETRINVTESHGQAAIHETISELLLGTGIFVVTPPALARWIDRWKGENLPIFNKNRLKIFAVDDFDTIYNRYGVTICEQIEIFCGTSIEDKHETPQLLITSSQWLPQLCKYSQFAPNPALYITNYIEASVYGRTQFRLNFVQSEKKDEILKQFIANDTYKKKRSLIVCTTDDEVTQICEYLKEMKVNYVGFCHETTEIDRNAALTWYQIPCTEDFTVLVCSDVVLGDLTGTNNVLRLLNYSLPDHWSTLSQRFAVFFGTFHDFVQNPKLPESFEATFAQILVDETDCRTLPRLVDFLTRINANFPDEVRMISRSMQREREREQASFDLCPFFLHFGIKLDECSQNKCGGRHALSSQDAPTARMPGLNTVLKLKIKTVHNPIHFSATILMYRHPSDNIWHNYQDTNQFAADADLKFKMQQYFANDDNKIRHDPINKGDLCVIDDIEYFHRVQILNITGNLNDKSKLLFTVRFIDTGAIHAKKFAKDIYVLPEHLKSIPPRAIDIHVIGIVPYDSDLFWSRRAKVMIEKTFEEFKKKTKENADCYVKAGVVFRLENHIWTDRVTLYESLVDEPIRQTSLHKGLLKEQLAELEYEHPQLDLLKEMADELEFDKTTTNDIDEPVEVPSIVVPVKEPVPIIPTYRSTWNYISQDVLHEIYINFLDDPKEFVVIRSDRNEKHIKLNDLIDTFAITDNCKIMEEPKVGDNCLIPLDDGKVRGRIINFGTDDQGDFIQVFSCDIGRLSEFDYSEVFETSKEIVEFMSYSAIQASFAGIEPVNGLCYDASVVSEIWELLDEVQQNGKLFAFVVGLKENCEWLPGINRYDLILVAKNKDGTKRLLNHEIVNKGWAKWNEEVGLKVKEFTVEMLEQNVEEKSESEEDENWEESVGVYKYQPPVEEEQNLKNEIDSFLSSFKNFEDDETSELLSMLGISPTEMSLYKKAINDLKTQSPPALKAIEPIQEEVIHEPATKPLKSLKEPIDILVTKTFPPLVLWQQTQSIIILSVKVGDTIDYHLEVHESHMILVLFPSTGDEEPRLTIINFFGTIIPKYVSHQIKGLNLIIRLPKLYSGIMWTQLQVENEKCVHIKYNLDTLKPLDDNFLSIRANKILEDDSESEFDIDSDEIFDESTDEDEDD